MVNSIAVDSVAQMALGDGDRLYVPAGATLFTANQATVTCASLNDNQQIVAVDGAVASASGNAIRLGLDDAGLGANVLTVGETGVVRSLNISGNSSVYMLGSGPTVTNYGRSRAPGAPICKAGTTAWR